MVDQKIRQLIVSTLNQTVRLLQKNDYLGLKELSDKIIQDVSTMQERHAVRVAVVVYSLSKIVQRTIERNQSISINMGTQLAHAAEFMQQDDEKRFDLEMKRIFKQISQRDEKLLMYVQHVTEKANIVKGSKLYSAGISLGTAAKILGTNQWDLMSFVGKTRIADEEGDIRDVKKRLAFARKLFKVS